MDKMHLVNYEAINWNRRYIAANTDVTKIRCFLEVREMMSIIRSRLTIAGGSSTLSDLFSRDEFWSKLPEIMVASCMLLKEGSLDADLEHERFDIDSVICFPSDGRRALVELRKAMFIRIPDNEEEEGR